MDNIDPIIIVYGIIALVLFILGAILLITGLIIRKSWRNWDKTEGLIVRDKGFFKSMPKGHPIATFVVDGVEYKHKSNISQNPSLRVGRQVEIFYNPYDPKQARINTLIQNGTFMIITGILLLLISPFPTSVLIKLLLN